MRQANLPRLGFRLRSPFRESQRFLDDRIRHLGVTHEQLDVRCARVVVHARLSQIVEGSEDPLDARLLDPDFLSSLDAESVLTVGAAAHDWREGHIDAVVSVGPLECMPNKIAEAQFFHVAEAEGLLSLTVSLNGDPVDLEILDRFAYEVHERFRTRREGPKRAESKARTSRLWDAIGRRWAPVARGTMPFDVFADRRRACRGSVPCASWPWR